VATAFVGPMSRFFARAPEEAAKLRYGVEAWRADLRSSVAEKVSAQLVWNEGSTVAQSFDLGESGWMGLRLFAFYAERSDLEMPDTVPGLLELDSEWRAAHDAKFGKTLYGQLLACRGWLPGDFPLTIKAPLPNGETAELGSMKAMADQLRFLNQRTFQADACEFANWLEVPAPAGAGIIDAARRGYAALEAAAALALHEGLPLLVREV
jgi:hypothetical protein